MKKRICHIISFVHESNELEWIIENSKEKHELYVILLNPLKQKQYIDSKFEQFLRNQNISLSLVNYAGKKDMLITFIKVLYILIKVKPKIVHAQLFDASLIGLLASFFVGVKHRVYTRHHSSFHHMFYPSAVKYDKLINKLATKIIAISKVVQDTLVNFEGASASKIVTIYHGNNFRKISFNSEKVILQKKKYNLVNKYPVIGVISRYIEWKGVQFIIPAFASILSEYPNAKLVLAGIGGDYTDTIQQKLKSLPPSSFVEIEFESDVWNLYKTFDIFAHVPINKHVEAFGQIYIEAMYSKTPMVCTKSGIANELLKHKQNALICEYQDSDSIEKNIKMLLSDTMLKFECSKAMSFENKITAMHELYSSLN